MDYEMFLYTNAANETASVVYRRIVEIERGLYDACFSDITYVIKKLLTKQTGNANSFY